MLVDFQACTNAVWDDKHVWQAGYDALRKRLENAGLAWRLGDYLSRLRELEIRRPPVGGDHRRFEDVRSYREAVARLSLATLVALACDTGDVDAEIRATHYDSDLETLFRIVMQCQIIDDFVDYAIDRSAGLPSFLTACASLPQAMELTAAAARRYGTSRESPRDGVLPLRMALRGCTLVTHLVVRSSGGLKQADYASPSVSAGSVHQ